MIASEEDRTRVGHENRGFLSESHGLLPVEPPRVALPESHGAWDAVAVNLAKLWENGKLRSELEDMSTLGVEETDLADDYLWRASCVMSMFANAYVHVDPANRLPLPPSISEPWQTISDRLERTSPHLSYNDLILYNWRLRDPTLPDPMRVENLDLLVPTVDTEEERIFYLTQVEIAAQCTPLVAAAVRAQEAVVRDDPEALEEELLRVIDRLRHVTEVSFLKIDPNPLSATHVNPVVWANLVAPFAVPIAEGVAGPSGTSSPVFHVLDAIFGRRNFSTYLGKEVAHLRPWFPPHVRDFIGALEEVSIREFVEKRGHKRLSGAFSSAFDAYAGDHSFLAVHRRKVYGFLEVAFKVGREVTITGFKGAFQDRTWKKVDHELESSRVERHQDVLKTPQLATLADRQRVEQDPHGTLYKITLDVDGTGIVYEPGDRCEVWVANTPQLVARTLQALRATGTEPIPLTRAWRGALSARGLPDVEQMPLSDVLRLSKLRPLLRDVAKGLLSVSPSPRLDEIVEAYREDQLELWDALEILAADGYDPARLWRAGLWQEEALTRILPPEPPRTYSISSDGDPEAPFPSRLELSVGQLSYRTPVAGSEDAARLGTASNYLTSLVEPGGTEQISVRVIHPLRFHLPRDPRRPIVMFAGGTGIAPFRGFLQQRAREPMGGAATLFIAVRTGSRLPFQTELEDLARRGVVDVRVAVSDEDVSLGFDDAQGKVVATPGPRQFINDLMTEPEVAAQLWPLLQPHGEGSEGGVFYVCGRAEFAHVVLEALKKIVGANLTGLEPAAAPAAANVFLRRAFAEGRIMQDTFTTFAPATAPGVLGSDLFDASNVALHNDEEHGYWLVINGAVYDMTEFRHLHPGGARIVDQYSGTDATREWEAVDHDRNSEVAAMLSMYKIGAIRRLNLGTSWGIVVGREGMEDVSLRDGFRAWVRFLYLVVEMQNAFRNDLGYLTFPLVKGDDPSVPTPLRMQLVANTHHRFLGAYLNGVVASQDLERLWAITIGLAAPNEDVQRLHRAVQKIFGSDLGKEVEAYAQDMLKWHSTLAAGADEATWEGVTQLIDLVYTSGNRFLDQARALLSEGVKAFERHESQTATVAGTELCRVLLQLPTLAESYQRDFLAGVTAIGGGKPFVVPNQPVT